MSELQRLAVFIDYQNAYNGARQAQGATEDGHFTVGQFDPLNLGVLIAKRHPSYRGARLRKLQQVRVYRGMPSRHKNSVGYSAALKQISRWSRSQPPVQPGMLPLLEVITRPLDYRTGEPREKGIDVLLALDLAFGAASGDFDVVVLFSGDSDLLPALERASTFDVVCESAVWQGGGRQLPRSEFVRWEHRLTEVDYVQVHDGFDYTPHRQSP